MKRVHCGLVILGAMFILFFRGAAVRADFTVMPLGDSITQGLSSNQAGYRTRLYSDLQNAGYSFTFVGTSTANPSPLLSQVGQTHHEGHPGYFVSQIVNNLDGNDGSNGNNGGFWFQKPKPPDIILLQIGGVDINMNNQTSTLSQRLDQLVGRIVADSPTSLLFISSLTPFTVFNANQNQLLQDTNMQIRDVIVPKYKSLGDNVFFVDQYSNFVDASGKVIHLSSDGIHPDQIGYDLMGDTWAAAVQQAAPVPEPSAILLLSIGSIGLLGYVCRHRRGGRAA